MKFSFIFIVIVAVFFQQTIFASTAIEKEDLLFENCFNSQGFFQPAGWKNFSYSTVLESFLKYHKRNQSLSEEAHVALHSYTLTTSYIINPGLRSGQITTENCYVKEIISALSKLPDYVGVVYRGQIQTLNKNIVGDEVTFTAFTSASYGNIADSWAKSDEILKIYSKHGKNIEDFSSRKDSDEHEVLFLPNSKFRLLKKTTLGKQVFVELEEISFNE